MQSHRHTHGTDTTVNSANIPLGTPREGSWEQGWLTKLERQRGVSMHGEILGIASMKPPQWSEMRGHLLPFTISILSGSSSVHGLRKQGLENSCSTTFSFPSSPQHFSIVLPGRDGFRGFSPTQGWPHSEVWPSNSGMICLKLQQLMEHGEYKSNWREINSTRRALLFTKHLHLQSWRWAL